MLMPLGTWEVSKKEAATEGSKASGHGAVSPPWGCQAIQSNLLEAAKAGNRASSVVESEAQANRVAGTGLCSLATHREPRAPREWSLWASALGKAVPSHRAFVINLLVSHKGQSHQFF